MTGFKEYGQYDGLGLAELVRKKEVQPIELVEEAIQRIEKLNPRLNAVVHKMYERAQEIATGPLPEGPFEGVPFLLKDLLAAYKDEPLTSGSRFMRGFKPDFDTELVKRFKASGVIALGKTSTSELGLVPYTEAEIFGPTNNPWDLDRIAGGSSGGSAVAVASRMVPLASGGDGGGSIRIPASCCGIFGLKPSRGRAPTGPKVGHYWHGSAVEHVLTRSVRDSAAMLDAIQGPDPGALYTAPPPERPFLDEVGQSPGKLCIAYSIEPLLAGEYHPDCLTGLQLTLDLLEDFGHDLIEASPSIDGFEVSLAFFNMLCAETAADIDELEALTGKKATSAGFEPGTWAMALLGRRLGSVDLTHNLRTLHRTCRIMGQFLDDYDMLLTPTLAEPPVLTGSLQLQGAQAIAVKLFGRLNAGWVLATFGGVESAAQDVFSFVPTTPLANISGQPAMSVPLHWNDAHLPVGMQFIARYTDEASLFRLAGQLEQAKPWRDRIPPVSA